MTSAKRAILLFFERTFSESVYTKNVPIAIYLCERLFFKNLFHLEILKGREFIKKKPC